MGGRRGRADRHGPRALPAPLERASSRVALYAAQHDAAQPDPPDPARSSCRRRSESRLGDLGPHRPGAAAGRDGNDGADAIRGAGSPPREGRTSGPVRRSQRRPARLQEPRRPPDAASARAQAWPPLLAPGKRHQPLHPHGALRQASSDDGRRRLAHHPGGLPRDGRNRSGRARRGGRARGASIRDRLSRGRRGLPRRRATAPLGPG